MSELISERIRDHAERLRLTHLAENAEALITRAEEAQMGYRELLDLALEEELGVREGRRFVNALKLSGLPHRKGLDCFDFAFQPSINRAQVVELASCAFVERAENVILLGPPGVGKSHIAIALGLEAASRRYAVKFTTAAKLTAALAEARTAGTFTRRLAAVIYPRLLIIDEVGFLPLDAEQAALLFEVVSRRYERGSIVLTANKSYGEWAEVFSGDAVIATAILDRLLHHSTIVRPCLRAASAAEVSPLTIARTTAALRFAVQRCPSSGTSVMNATSSFVATIMAAY